MSKDTTVARKKILVIDNEVELLTLIKELLEDGGYRVFCAADGAEGLRLHEREKPDLIILDLRMPGMDGIETLRRLRQIDPRVRVVILTAYGSPDSIRAAADMDVSDYIGKPFDNEHFVRVIREALGRCKEDPK